MVFGSPLWYSSILVIFAENRRPGVYGCPVVRPDGSTAVSWVLQQDMATMKRTIPAVTRAMHYVSA